jgi:chemotaxis protein methyltransferase WspC
MDWTDLENRLAQTIGLESSALGSTVLRQSVGRRLQARAAETLPEYIKLLDAEAAELQALIEELVVRESWFFRHAHAFELLRRHAVSTMANRHEPYRVLCIPCAGGEEPYSIVMSLREAGLDFDQFQVDAADISETALRTAQAGNYKPRSVRVVAPAIQDRYFRVSDQSVEVLPEIRQAVRFTRANIIEASFSFNGHTFDAVFCRNLLIYLTPAARQRVMQKVAQWLSPSGLFFVGHAEMLREFEGLFEPVPERGAFAYCRRAEAAGVQTGRLPAIAAVRRSAGPTAVRAHPLAASSISKVRSGNLAQTAAPIDSLSAQDAFNAKSRSIPSPSWQDSLSDELAHRVSRLSSEARHPEAIEACQKQLLQQGPSPRVYHILGMVFHAAGSYDEAEQAFERAVYLDPDHEEALLALSLLARRRGAVQIADRFEQRSQRAHDRRQRP